MGKDVFAAIRNIKLTLIFFMNGFLLKIKHVNSACIKNKKSILFEIEIF